MTARVISKPWQVQPSGGRRVARSSLTRDLRLLYTDGVDAVTGRVATPVGSIPTIATAQGLAQGPVASDATYLELPNPFNVSASTGLAAMTVLVLSQGGSGGVVLGKANGNGQGLRVIGATHGQYAAELYIGSERFSSGPYGAGLYNASGLNCYAARRDASAVGWFVNGRRNADAYYVGGYSDWDPALTTIQILAQSGGGYADSSVLLLALWERNLSDEELAAVTARPWQLFESQRLFIPQASGIVLPTLSAATYVPGSITSSGFRPRVTAT